MTTRFPSKHPTEVLDYKFDWSDAIGEATIASHTVNVTGGTLNSSSVVLNSVIAYISGGTSGIPITATCTITTSTGLTLRRFAVIPFGEPVTLEEAKLHCRIDADDEDLAVARYISSARAMVEGMTGRLLAQRIKVEAFDRFCDPLTLKAWPITGTPTVSYVDTTGATQTVPSIRVFANEYPVKIRPAYGAVWPTTDTVPQAVTVTATAGYGEGQAPDTHIQAILLLVSAMYDNRGEVPASTLTAVNALLANDRSWL
jgi:uncharacterized phiE125 gp8 family phage protein